MLANIKLELVELARGSTGKYCPDEEGENDEEMQYKVVQIKEAMKGITGWLPVSGISLYLLEGV